MEYKYKTEGTCSKEITFDIDEQGILHNVHFLGGCPGNTLGVSFLCEGKPAKDVINILKGIKCGYKPTSCPDQLSKAIEKAIVK